MRLPKPRLRFFAEVLGISLNKRCWRQARLGFRGDQYIPKSRADISSLMLLGPRIAFPLWLGRAYLPRTVIITNLFNHTQTPIQNGWSIRKKKVRDFRGHTLSYDSHNGTDFAIPVGTRVLSAAAGKVVWMCDELNRGGKKIFIDHGKGLMTTYAHLARALVHVGMEVKQGQPIAWSGYSGLDAVISFPFGIPHVHMNVWHNGVPVDPFSNDDESSLWIHGFPEPSCHGVHDYVPSEYDPQKVNDGIQACLDPKIRHDLELGETLEERASLLLMQQNYYPTRFSKRISPYMRHIERTERLCLPFSSDDFDRVVFRDEV